VRNAATRGVEADLGAPDSEVRILVIPTNEELVVAREVRRHLESTGRARRVEVLAER
jgi:acetate kinase